MSHAVMTPDLQAFSEHLVAHPRLLSVQDHLEAAIGAPGDADLVLVPGPTGVGKTTMVGTVSRHQRLGYSDLGPGTRPVISVLTPSYSAHGFAFKDLLYALLAELLEPGTNSKVMYPPVGDDIDFLIRRRRDPEGVLRAACINALKRRGVRIIFLDEAQHLCKAGGPVHIEAVLESLKYLILATGVRIVLAGTDDLTHMIDLNGQLSRRIEIVHFGRYRADVQADVDAFVSVLDDFQAALPMLTFSLADHWHNLYDWSIGRVGSLKNLLLRALFRAEASHTQASLDDFRPNAAEWKSLDTQLGEILTGEARFSAAHAADNVRDDNVIAAKPTRVKPPFTRNPERDPVGDPGSEAA